MKTNLLLYKIAGSLPLWMAALAVGAAVALAPAFHVAAAPASGACGAKTNGQAGDTNEAGGTPAAPAAPARTGPTYCTPFNESNPATARGSDNGNEFIRKYITPTIKAMSALAGIAITGSVIFGGIQYATAGGDSGKVSAAKKRIMEAIFILLAYIFFYAFMRWLIPSGVPG